MLKEKVVVSNIPPQFFAATALPSPDKVDHDGNYKDERYAWFNTYEYPTLRDYFYNVGGVAPVYLIYNPTDDDKAVMEECGAKTERFGYSFYLFYWE